MHTYSMTNGEISLKIAAAFKQYRVDPRGRNMTQAVLSERSGVSLTSIKRFEKTGHITLSSLLALMRALYLLESAEALIPNIPSPGPLEILAQMEKTKPARTRASRKNS